MQRVALAKAIAVALLMGGVMQAAAAVPQQSSTMPKASQQAQVTVDIAAQPLQAALQAFALQTGIQVAYAGEEVVHGLQAPAVAGSLTPVEILRRLLDGSGLRFEFVNSQMVSIAKAAARDSAPRSMAPGQPEIHIDADAFGDATDIAKIIVTGTNLRGIDPASPMLTIDSSQIEAGGYSSLEDVLRDLPQNFSSRTSFSAAMGETEFGDSSLPKSSVGASSINLRGLGSRSTLILVNGRRIAGSAQGQGSYTDISSIPLAQVERIEVLTDGASAIYGADAVAGVVNIVLKDHYEGTLLQARMENSSSGADALRVDAARTFSWNSGFLTAAASFRKSRPAETSKFIHVGPSGRGDFTDLGGVNARIPGVGQPGVVYEGIDLGFGSWMRGDPLGLVPNGQNGTALQPGDLLPYDAASAPSAYWTQRIGPEILTPSLRIAGEQDLSTGMTLRYGASFTRQRNQENWKPLPYDFSFMAEGASTFVSASNVHNHFGRDVLVGYSFAREFDGMQFSQEQAQSNLNFNIGLKGQLPWADGWEFDVGYNDSSERGRSDDMASTVGLGEYGVDPRITNFVDNINVFGDGSDPDVVAANRALLNALVERYRSDFDSRMRDLDVLVRGDLFKLPGGQAQLAVGGQLRNERYHLTSTLGGASTSDTERKARALYAELGMPLLKDAPGAKDLTLTLAARYDAFDQAGTNSLVNYAYDYDFANDQMLDLIALGGFNLQQLTGAVPGAPYEAGPTTQIKRRYSSTSPLVRLSWRPFADLRLRATWGESFLPADASQQFGLDSAQVGTYAVLFNGGVLPPGVTSIVSLSGPNANLKPQEATTKTFGFDYNPHQFSGLTLSATYNDTFFDNYIGDPLAGLSYAEIFGAFDKMPAQTFVMGDNGVMLWDARQVNFLGRRSRTVDASVNYMFDNDWGDWTLALNAVRTLELTARTLPSFPTTVFSNSEFGPSNWAADVLASWSRGGWFASLGAHYSSDFRVLYPLSGQATIYNNWTPSNPNPRRHASSYTTVDFQLGYGWRKNAGWLSNTVVRFGMQNAFDRAFPFVDNQYGFLSNRVDVRGRVIYLDLRKEF